MFEALDYLRPEYKTLITLCVKGRATVEELQKATGLALATLYKHLAVYQALGFVARESRGLYRITDAGREHVERVLDKVQRMIRSVLDKLNDVQDTMSNR